QSIYTEESHILNLAVKSTRQGQGLGRGLVKKACADARKGGVMKILLEVCPNNLIARQLYESEGFLVFGRRNSYYRSGGRAGDALVMERVLEPASVMTQ
ncbi:MAG: GNAT family N-acetyltransferase, partial [Pseudomonadota bacterium]|nr:GNAT family N-acetyltransferase [Pseudomonadota bacterium]